MPALLAAVLATAGCGAEQPVVETSRMEQTTVAPSPTTGITAVECGEPFRPPAAGGLTVSGDFPVTVHPGEQAVSGTVEVTSRTAVRGVVTPQAEVFLVREGRVVTVPLPQDSLGVRLDLSPGETERFPGAATLMSCDPAGGRVPSGSYELYARVVVTPDDGPAGESFGGPWPVEVQ